MTRKQQIEQAWLHSDAMQLSSFRRGAEWADEHPKSPWISVNLKLPEIKNRVLFLCNNGKAYFGYNNIDNESATVINAPEGVKVTHWMPIPELP